MENYTDIKDVKVNIPDAKDPMSAGAIPMFHVTTKDGTAIQVPINQDNRHYWMVKEWFNSKRKAPFDFDFAKFEKQNPSVDLTDPEALEPSTVNGDSPDLPVLSAVQTEDVDSNQINLTKAQIKELNDQR